MFATFGLEALRRYDTNVAADRQLVAHMPETKELSNKLYCKECLQTKHVTLTCVGI